MRPIAVLPTTSGPETAQAVYQALRDQRLDYDVVASAECLGSPLLGRAEMAVLLVRKFGIEALELSRLLGNDLVPTFVVGEELSETDEATLLQSGVYDVVRTTISPDFSGCD